MSAASAGLISVSLFTLTALAALVYYYDAGNPMLDMENGLSDFTFSRRYAPQIKSARPYDTDNALIATSLEKQSLARRAKELLVSEQPSGETSRRDFQRTSQLAVENSRELLAPPAPVRIYKQPAQRCSIPDQQ
jgi:hypothetical protein